MPRKTCSPRSHTHGRLARCDCNRLVCAVICCTKDLTMSLSRGALELQVAPRKMCTQFIWRLVVNAIRTRNPRKASCACASDLRDAHPLACHLPRALKVRRCICENFEISVLDVMEFDPCILTRQITLRAPPWIWTRTPPSDTPRRQQQTRGVAQHRSTPFQNHSMLI